VADVPAGHREFGKLLVLGIQSKANHCQHAKKQGYFFHKAMFLGSDDANIINNWTDKCHLEAESWRFFFEEWNIVSNFAVF
jgi:hypothetical protein